MAQATPSCHPDPVELKQQSKPIMFAVQPTSFGTFDEYGADYAPTIAAAYRIAAIRQQEQEGDQMIWKLTTGNPIPWVRVYEGEDISSVTTQELALLV